MKIGFIDPYMETPAIECFNDLIDLMNQKIYYYSPSKLSMDGLNSLKDKCDAYIVVGSASHVTEELSWHGPLFDFLLSELKKNKPILGCCFGHQLMCYGLGGRVGYYQDDQQKIKGVRQITVTKDWGPFRKNESFHLAVSHKQVVQELPKDLVEIGVGFRNDLVAHTHFPLLLTQAHPEVSSNVVSDDEIKNEADLLKSQDGKKLIKRFFDFYF